MSIKSPIASASMPGGKNVISIMRPTTVMQSEGDLKWDNQSNLGSFSVSQHSIIDSNLKTMSN